MSEEKAKWLDLGSVLTSKDGESFYIKIRLPKDMDEVVLTNDMIIQLQKPHVQLDRLLEFGIITEEEHSERLTKIPEYVKYRLVLPPKRD